MKLWLLRPIHPNGNDPWEPSIHPKDINDPWEPWYNKAFGFVIRSETEQRAREIANEKAGDENHGTIMKPWLDPKHSTCEELLSEGPEEPVIRDFSSA